MEPNELLDATQQKEDKDRHGLNARVAITVALLATLMGICKVKDDNIVQAMQQAQADKIDNWGWYQAKKTRDLVMEEHVFVLRQLAAAASPSDKVIILAQVAKDEKQLSDKRGELADVKKKAEQNAKDYDDLNYRDDQFDLSDSSLAIAISMLAVTALTQKKFLFWIAMVPTLFGGLMGFAGLLGWHIHPDFLAKLLGT